jgi:small subunit ribosomal protein S4e|tara:strand:+ start:1088 stop:1810 length:723 start_codon:yes stop_codon:yes gene_type:complete
LTRKAGSKSLKRSMAPNFWTISVKSDKFISKPMPGPHKSSASYSLVVLIRDILKLTNNSRESRSILNGGQVYVDGVIRKNERFPVGLMDVIGFPKINEYYRLLPRTNSVLSPISMPENEKSLKLCKITSKITVNGGKTQYSLHDGRSIVVNESNASNGDSLLIEIPSQKIVKVIPFLKGSNVLTTGGAHPGLIGSILEINPGTFTRSSSAHVKFDDADYILPTRLLFAIGSNDEIPIKLN